MPKRLKQGSFVTVQRLKRARRDLLNLTETEPQQCDAQDNKLPANRWLVGADRASIVLLFSVRAATARNGKVCFIVFRSLETPPSDFSTEPEMIVASSGLSVEDRLSGVIWGMMGKERMCLGLCVCVCGGDIHTHTHKQMGCFNVS